MGKLVAFWSPYAGKAKVTSSLCAIAGAFGMEFPEISVAISHIAQDSMALEERLDDRAGKKIRQDLYRKTGIAALKLNYRQAVLTSEKVRRSAISLPMKSLYLYPCREQSETSDELTFHLLTEWVKSEFDLVFLDLKSGRNEESERFLKTADLIVVVLPQAPEYQEQFFQKEEDCLEGRRYCILLGGYLENSKYSRRYYSRKRELHSKGEFAGVIPVNPGFLDAMSEGKTLDYFLKNQRVRKKEENYEFMVQTKKAADYIKKSIFFS